MAFTVALPVRTSQVQVQRKRVQSSSPPARVTVAKAAGPKKKGGFLKNLRDTILRPMVTVPGAEGRGELMDCVFCTGEGKRDCDGCSGTGLDFLGKCLMCDGKKKLVCDVCSGVGIVDRVRRGGTDDENDWVMKQPPRRKQ